MSEGHSVGLAQHQILVGALLVGLTLPPVVGCEGTTASLDVAGIEVAINPGNPLSATVRWSTDLPATSRVEYGTDTEPVFFVEGEGLVTEHEVVVIGMRPDTTYRLHAESVTERGIAGRADPLEFTTGSFPHDEFYLLPTLVEGDLMQPGWTLANVIVSGAEAPVVVAMFDAEGHPVWVHALDEGIGGRGDIDVSLVDGPRVLVGGGVAPGSPVELDLAGEVVWRGPVQDNSDFLAEGQMHHQLQKLANDDYLTLTWEYDDGVYDALVQFDEAGDEVWRWDATDHLPPGDLETYIWGNSAIVDLVANAIYYNAVANSTLYKIDRDDGSLLWELGYHGDFAVPNDQELSWHWFGGAHGPELQPDGNLLMYDNGTAERGYSRVVEYALDEVSMEARIVFEYPGDGTTDLFSNIQWGDADRLANGNTLVTSGSTFDGATPSRLFELTPDGDRVWDVSLESSDPAITFGSYGADRIPCLVGSMGEG